MTRRLIAAMLLSCLHMTSAAAEERKPRYAGALVGISTLSADARSERAPEAQVSLYAPENGPALNVLFGLHVHEYVAMQASYIWNRNDLVLTSLSAAEGRSSFTEQHRNSLQHALVGDLLVYFRERSSVLRPYLSAGLGVIRLEIRDGEGEASSGGPAPARSQTVHALLRVAVGIDVTLTGGWIVRYTFSESLSGNPISAQLSPPGQRKLANFQNLLGVMRAF